MHKDFSVRMSNVSLYSDCGSALTRDQRHPGSQVINGIINGRKISYMGTKKLGVNRSGYFPFYKMSHLNFLPIFNPEINNLHFPSCETGVVP